MPKFPADAPKAKVIRQITHALYEVGGQCRRSMLASPSAAGGTSMDRHEP